MKRALPWLLVLAACGEDPPAASQLTLADAYDVVAVARWFPDGLNVRSHRSLGFAITGVRASGGRVLLEAEGATTVGLSGTFDAESGEARLDPVEGALTSTTPGRIAAFGFRGDDGSPKDGDAEEITGYVNTRIGDALEEARFIGSARAPNRPPAPDLAKISLSMETLGRYRLRGTPGAVAPSAGVEVLRHQESVKDPTLTGYAAESDGGFDLRIDALRGDILLLRARSAGRPSGISALAVP